MNVSKAGSISKTMLLQAKSRKRLLVALLLCVAAVVACRPSPRAVVLPPVVETASLGVGDVFMLEIVGEQELPKEYTVAPDGTVDIPYINRIKVAGLEPQQVSELVRGRLVTDKILSKPSVSVRMKAYNSKRIVLTGEVKKTGSMVMVPGMTLVRAVSQAGGLTPLARRHNIVLRRRVGKKTRRVVVDYDAITNNEIPDVPLQAGDTIHVPQRIF